MCKDRKNTIMANRLTDTAIYILIQHYQNEEFTFDCYDMESLKAMLMLRQNSNIDNRGQITNQGNARSLMELLDLKFLDVLALAYIAARPVNAARERFEWIAFSFSVPARTTYKTFNKLRKMKLIRKLSLGVFAVGDASRLLLREHMPALKRIDADRDNLFERRTSIV